MWFEEAADAGRGIVLDGGGIANDAEEGARARGLEGGGRRDIVNELEGEKKVGKAVAVGLLTFQEIMII